MKIRIAFLHGLESNNTGSKIEWLKTVGEIYAPLIDYYQAEIYQTIKSDIINFKPDLIIGSSMGGFFSFEIAKELNIPAVLFNPAIHSRTFTPDMTGNSNGGSRPEMFIVLGEKDEIINPNETFRMLSEDGFSNIKILSHSHRTPIEVFASEIQSFLRYLSL